MRAEFYREGDIEDVVASVEWDGRRPVFEEETPDTFRRALEHIFRPAPVVTDDAAYRQLGAKGDAVIQPGTLEWFREAALSRAGDEGLGVRIVPEIKGEGGWDPASAYRTFRATVRRIFDTAAREGAERKQPGETGRQERARTGDQPRTATGPRQPGDAADTPGQS